MESPTSESLRFDNNQSNAQFDNVLFELIHQELTFQNTTLNLIAASNYLSPMVGSAMNAALNNIHCEGYPGKRYHEGQQYADSIELLAIDRAKRLFGADHANVQPYRGTMANVAACVATCEPGETILGFECEAGGHFTTGSPIHITGRMFEIKTYSLDKKTELLDYDAIERQAQDVRPQSIFVGDTAYPGAWDWQRMRHIADNVGAALVADVSQTAGLIAAGAAQSPIPFADVVTLATYKTLRGPRAGIILCNENYRSRVDRAVFPICQDGTNVMLIAGLAASLFEAAQPSYRQYCQRVLDNARELSRTLARNDLTLVTGGTTNHACLINLSESSYTGRQAARALASASIICNANQVPFDTGPPANPNGLRVGTAAVTTLGMGQEQMSQIGDMIQRGLSAIDDEPTLRSIGEEARNLRSEFREHPDPVTAIAPNGATVPRFDDIQG